MDKFKWSVPLLLAVLAGLVGVSLAASLAVDEIESRGRSVAARGLAAVLNHVQAEALELVGEAGELGRNPTLGTPPAGEETLRWLVDAKGQLVEGFGVGFEAGKPDLAGMGAVARGLQGVASDAIIALHYGGKDHYWHIAASPTASRTEAGAQVGGVAVVGRPLAYLRKGLAEEIAALGADVDLPMQSVLVVGRQRLAGQFDPEVVSLLKPGKLDGSVLSVGKVRLSFGLVSGPQRFVVGNVMLTEGGRLAFATVVDAMPAYQRAASKITNALLAVVIGSGIAGLLLFFTLRSLERDSNTLITWLHTCRNSGAGAPVESLGLRGTFDRIARNMDLIMASQGPANAPPTAASVDMLGAFGSPDSVEASDFESFSSSSVFELTDPGTETSSAGTVSLFAGLEDTETKAGELPPLPPELGLPKVPAGKSEVAPAPDLAAKAVDQDRLIAPENPEMQFDDAATGQFEVPDSLLEQIAETGDPGTQDDDPMAALFTEYVGLRERLGEETEGLTLEHFVRKLETTRARIMEQTGAADIRFSVREKNGSASLRALPIHS